MSAVRKATKPTKATSAEPEHVCEFCKKKFVTERTLVKHLCDKKRRWLWKDEKYAQIAFRAFQRFYQLSMRQKKPKTEMDFINSAYYNEFIKFGKFVVDVNAIDVPGFIDFLIKTSVNLSDWTKDWAYETWVRELGRKEDPYRAVERNILLMEQWSRETGDDWQDFFKKVNPNLAVKWIRSGRISPWVIYAVGEPLMDRMNEDQLKLIRELINPNFWTYRIKANKKDFDAIVQILEEAGVSS